MNFWQLFGDGLSSERDGKDDMSTRFRFTAQGKEAEKETAGSSKIGNGKPYWKDKKKWSEMAEF